MAPRYSVTRNNHIEYAFWLVFGDDGTMRFSRSEPTVSRGERSMSLTAKLPLSLFRTPELRAVIKVDGTTPASFNIDVGAAGEALRHALGVDIDLQVRTPDAE
jgi:hypothetical protein